jgi:hypothetical protein
MFGVVGAAFYLLRRWMRLVRWSIAIAVLVLHLFVMNGPVWHLLSRIDLSGGSDAYHRQMLIDQALAHADEWWLVGSNIGSAHWGFLTADMTNLYIVQGLHGGVGLIALFLLIICFGFADVGRMMRDSQDQKHVNRCAWALGICLFIHVMNFVAVSYFGQINMIWYMLLATIASLAPLGAKLPFKASRTPSAKLAGATTKRPARSARPARVAVLDEEIHRIPRQDARTV